MRQPPLIRSILSALLVAGFLPALAWAKAPQTITIRSDEWCPFLCDPASEQPGIMVEIARKAFPAPDYAVDVQILEWTKAVEGARAGQFTMIAGAYRSDAPDFIFPGEGQAFNRDCFYARSDNHWFYTNPASLDSIQLGVIADYSYGDEIDGWVKANPGKVTVASGETPLEDNLKRVEKGELEALIESSAVVQWSLMQHNIPMQIRQAGCAGKGEELFLAISPKAPDAAPLAQRLTSTVSSLRASGELKKMLARYGLYDWK